MARYFVCASVGVMGEKVVLQCYNCGYTRLGSRNRKFHCPVCHSGSYQWYLNYAPSITTPKQKKELINKENKKHYNFKMGEVFGYDGWIY